MHYRIDLAQTAECCSQAVIFCGLAEGASPGPDTFPELHPNALQAASRQLFAQAKSVQGANQTSPLSVGGFWFFVCSYHETGRDGRVIAPTRSLDRDDW